MRAQLQLQLVMQSNVTIAVGEVPVLNIAFSSSICCLVHSIVNFLRSGCPHVQVVTNDDEEQEKFDEERIHELLRSLTVLELPGESFTVEKTGDDYVLLVTRKVPPKRRRRTKD